MDKDLSNIARSLVFVYSGYNWVLACRMLEIYFPGLRAPPQIRRVRPACAPPKFGGFWSCSSCSSYVQATRGQTKPVEKPWAMESKGKARANDDGVEANLPPSQQTYPVWEMTVETRADDLKTIFEAVQARAHRLLERLRNGGTEDPLRCMCYFACRIDQLHLTSSVEELSSSTEGIVVLPELPKAPPQKMRLHIVLIMDGTGRLKSSVKRSMQNLLKGAHNVPVRLDPFAAALLNTLRPQTFAWALAMQRNSSQTHVDWVDTEVSCLKTYLTRRESAEGTTPPSEKVSLGIDLLGPKRPAPPQPPMPPMKMLKGPAGECPSEPSEPQEPSRGPDPNMVRACAMFVAQKGEVTQEQAEAALKQLLLDLHDTTEELHKAKLELSFYKQRDALHSQVHMLSFSHLTRVLCHSSHVCLSFCCLLCGADNDTSGLDNGYTPSTTPRP